MKGAGEGGRGARWEMRDLSNEKSQELETGNLNLKVSSM